MYPYDISKVKVGDVWEMDVPADSMFPKDESHRKVVISDIKWSADWHSHVITVVYLDGSQLSWFSGQFLENYREVE